ncbi:MAG: transglutaminase domain-containing protein [Nitrospinae bacterium]|nr:transglutaminase domain-containing protein [Nitrospinota bacterium]
MEKNDHTIGSNLMLINEEWMGVYLNGRKLGFVHSSIREWERGYIINSRAYIKLKAMGEIQETSFTQESYLTKGLIPESFTLFQEMMGHRQRIEGILVGDTMKLEISSAGVTSKKEVGLVGDVSISGALGFVIYKKGLEVGKSYSMKAFLEPLQIIIPIEIEIKEKKGIELKGKRFEVFVIEERYGNLVSTIWMTEDGETIKEISMEGLESIREEEDVAINFEGGIIPISSFITMSLIKPDTPIENPDKVRMLKVRLMNISDPDLIISDQRQKIVSKKRGDRGYEIRLDIRSEEIKEGGEALSVKSKIKDKKSNIRYIEDTPEIQSSHHEIKARAKEIIGDEKDAWKAAVSINEWIYNYLEKRPVDTFSAMDALKSKEGECQSHTNLYAAMARSLGIPTKVVSGLVYSPEHKGFLYHAWPEVYVGRWIALDPSLGQTTVDATHIKLVEGGWGEQLKLFEFIGKIRIEVLDQDF